MSADDAEARSICSACGARWASLEATCTVCESSDAKPRDLVFGDAIWVAAFASFTCRTCGETSPMHALEADCKVECAGCGQVQLLDPDVFSEAMALAWEIGDYGLRGPFPLDEPKALRAKASTLRALGLSEVVAELVRTGVSIGATADRNRNVRMRLAPGHPLCETCREPLETAIDAHGLVVSCTRCLSSVTYARPENPAGIEPFPLAALDGSLREGAVEADLEDAPGGVVTLRCPVCAAALTGVDGRGLARCGYCKAVARVAPRLRALAGASNEPTTAPYWMLFHGDSPSRREVVGRAKGREQRRRAAEARRAREAEQRSGGQERRRTAWEVEQERRAARAERKRRGASEKPAWRVPFLLAMGLLGVILPLALKRYVADVAPTGRPPGFPPLPASAASPPYEEPAMSGGPEAIGAPGRSARPAAVQTLPSNCGCPVPREGGGATELAWGIETQSMVRFGSDITLSVAYSWVVDGETFPVLASDQTAPPNPIRTPILELAVACDDDAMLVSDGRYVTRWSLRERRVVASAAAPSPFTPRAPGEGVSGECYRATMRGGSMRFEDAGGLAHRIRLPRELR